MGKLDGKVAIVSGSGRGIGKAIALKFASEGARVVVNDLDPDACAAAVAEVVAAGGQAVGCPGSVTEAGFPDRFVKTALERFGGLDIIVNNAGYTWDNVIQKMTDEQWDAILDVHLKAPFRILRAASEYLRATAKKEAEAGKPVHRKVVNISSVSGTVGNAGQANYSSAKAGIIGLTRALAKEWGRYKVNVNAVAFGLIETRLTTAPAHGGASIDIEGRKIPVGINPDAFSKLAQIIPLGRAGTPEDAAGAVFLFCIPEADYVTGECLTCGGGYKMS
ncbi:MAG: SDR family oxidoreductase [Gemmatimonadales bacterium]|nr:SDR family oxidoreductase [Gemmatimonadales bacterium]